MQSNLFFKETNLPWRRGWYIPVRSDWSYNLKDHFITDDMKEDYEDTFGRSIIFEKRFWNWYQEQLCC